MGKASRTKQQPDRRARIAAQREAERRRAQRKRIYLAGGSILVVAIIAVAFVIFKSNGSSTSSASSNGPTGTALASVVKTSTSVPAATLDKVGSAGTTAITPPAKISPAQAALASGGKPEMLYVGAEYCPYCAAERWSMVVALSRFGTFTGLATVHSSSTDVYANTPTWTFAHATYTSPYLAFDSVEEYTNIATAAGGYTTLQTPTAAQQAIFTKFDAPPYVSSAQDDGSYPFIDFGNKYLTIGASYSPQVLDGKTWAQIATALNDPTSTIALNVDGTANYLTAAICEMTGNQPATACTSVVKSLESKL